MYKVAIYYGKERLECHTAYTDYYQARSQFKSVCKTYRELPLDAICSLERDSKKLEAYRFTSSYDTLPVDTLSSSLCDMVGRRASFTSPRLRRPSTEMLNVSRELDLLASVSACDAEEGTNSDFFTEQTLQEPLERRAVMRQKQRFFERIRQNFLRGSLVTERFSQIGQFDFEGLRAATIYF